jgi:polyisoprenoid-binding protein YceI
MLKKSLALFGILGFALAPAGFTADEKWAIDPMHSDAHFSIKHMMVSNVQGDFGKLTGTAEYDGEHFDKAQVQASVPIGALTTREEKRDGHLKSPDFFDAEKYPTMDFKSKKITVKGGEFKMYGDLTLHGVTKEVVLTGKVPAKAIKDPMGKIRIGTEAKAEINRKDFGLNWNKALDNGGAMIGDEVEVTLDVELVKA